MSPNSYPKYKDSGVDWLNDVPEHWHITPLGKHFTLRNVTVSDKDFVPLSVTMSGIVPQMENVAKTENGDSRKLVRRGDFVINSRSDRKGSSGLSDYDGSVSQISIVLVPHRIAPKFTHHLLRSVPFQEEFYRFGTGIVADLWSTRFSSMKAIRLALPPISEQEAIAAYLDRETDEIDAFIADQEELIALLAERRTATITQAVTKGLDPAAPMKDSGNQWIAALPAHWAVTAMKHLTELQTGVTLGKTYSEDAEEYPYLRVANVQVGYVDLSTLKTVQVTKEVANRSMLRPGDVLMTEGGDRDKLGRGCIWDAQVQPCLHQNHVFAVRCSEQLSNAFLVYVLDSQVARNYFNVTAKQTTNLAATNSTLVKNFRFGLPPLTEQHDILAYLDRETAEIDAAIADAREAIALSKERRAAVISAAVTGKIDVRGLVAPATSNVEAESVGIA